MMTNALPRCNAVRPPAALALLLLGALAAPPVSAQPAPADSTAVVRLAQRAVDTLASPAMAGRGYRQGGHRRAARYLRRQFKKIGLEPVSSSYVQRFSVRAGTFPKAPSLEVDERPLELGEAFLPMASTASGTGEAPVVRVGRGLVLPQQSVNAYAGKSVEGRVVVIDGSTAPDSLRDIASGEALSRTTRIQHAEERGARAVIWLRDHISLAAASRRDAAVPVFQVRPSAWPPDARRARFEVRHRRDQRFHTQNVTGKIEGATQPDSVLLLVAHYDHVGALGDSVYFAGANDNASGTAMLLVLARYFAAHPPACTLVFTAFSGEEVGLVGSRYFAARPPFDLSRAAFLLNFDMVASGTEGITAVGGVDYPRAFAQLRAAADSLGAGPLSKRTNAPNSDHYFLTQRGVPGFFLYTKAGEQPYHSPRDVPATLEWGDFWQVYRLARTFIKQRCEGP
jgi:Iap family predicted aminopeptidase